MQIVYAPEQPPERFSKSIFLAGPSPRGNEDLNWRPKALEMLEKLGYDGVVFVPLPRDGQWNYGYDIQVEWERVHLDMADVVAFWVPRNKQTLPGLTTNVEFGMYVDSGKIVLGYPPEADSMRYLAHHGAREHVPMYSSLEETLESAVRRIGEGAERFGGERSVPIHIWRLPHFQQWLAAQRAAGNRLDGAKLLWSFRAGKKKDVTFAYAVHVDVYVAQEDRHKTNEFIIGRPDIATVVAYRKRATAADTEIVLVREFRSPGRTSDGFVRELPGGSSAKPDEDPFSVAAHEFAEETGFDIDPSRLRRIGARQLAATFSTHVAHVFAVELTEQEIAILKRQKGDDVTHGVVEDTERTYVEVHQLKDLLDPASNFVDWSMLGMIVTTVT